MHTEPTPKDAPTPDPDATGYDVREHEHGQHAVPHTAYQIWHHEHPVSREYGSATEAELFRIFSTPGTSDYVVRPVRATEPTPTTEANT